MQALRFAVPAGTQHTLNESTNGGYMQWPVWLMSGTVESALHSRDEFNCPMYPGDARQLGCPCEPTPVYSCMQAEQNPRGEGESDDDADGGDYADDSAVSEVHGWGGDNHLRMIRRTSICISN